VAENEVHVAENEVDMTIASTNVLEINKTSHVPPSLGVGHD
jgi:hypothetical protein